MKRTRAYRIVIGSATLLGLTVASLTGCGSPASSAPAPQAAQVEPMASSSSIGMYGASEGLDAAPALGVILDQAGRVIDFEAGSAAQQAGIQKGDVLLAFDDLQVASALSAASVGREIRSDHAQLRAFREKIAIGKAIKINVQRGGQKIDVNVTPGPRPAQPNQPTPTAVPVEQLYL